MLGGLWKGHDPGYVGVWGWAFGVDADVTDQLDVLYVDLLQLGVFVWCSHVGIADIHVCGSLHTS